MKLSRKDRTTLSVSLAVLSAIGLVAGLYVHRSDGARWIVVLADVLFTMGSVILMWGLVRQLGNLHMFTSTTYGFHRFHDLFRGKQMKGNEMKEDYLSYRESRPNHPEAKPLILIGAVVLAVSVVVSVIAVA